MSYQLDYHPCWRRFLGSLAFSCQIGLRQLLGCLGFSSASNAGGEREIERELQVDEDDAYGRLPRHKIFISHSGNQKDFAEQLCKDLEAHNYSPFFDKRPDSLPEGEHFPSLILEAAKEFSLAIVLLSQDFLTRSKWPLIELSTFVETQQSHPNVKILPVLLGSLRPEDLNDTAINTWSRQYWSKLVESDKRLTIDDIRRWAIAVKALRPLKMILQCKYDGEVPLRSKIVRAVSRRIPPDVRCDVSHIQGKDRLKEEIMALFSKAATAPLDNVPNGATIVGVYGIAGSGKSTLCTILAHCLRGEFKGRVCHVDLGKEDMSTLNLQIKVLLKLTSVSHDYVHNFIKAEEEGWTCLMERISGEKVFLALDSVSDKPESLEFARKFVDKIEYHVNSRVLVTSCSKDILHKRLGITESCCMHCPHLMETEASEIVLDHLNLNWQVAGLTKKHSNILEKVVKICDWRGHIHPMALKVLASQLGKDPSKWNLSGLSLLESSDKEHGLLAPMEKHFERLPDQQTKDILHKHLGISESCCMHCPHLMETEASEIVLDHLNLNSQVAGLTKKHSSILEKVVKICDWGGHIHPMALKLLASQLGKDPSKWNLSGLSLLESSDKEHGLLAPMEKHFERLPDQQTKDIFMDIALCTPESISNVYDMCLWLKETLHPSCRDLDSVRRKLDILRVKSLLEVWSIESDTVRIHNLHYQLARRIARLEDATDNKLPRFVYQFSGNVSPTETLGARLAERIERACLIGSSCTALAFEGCSSLKLLSLRSCNNLARLKIRGLGTLISLELSTCPLRTLNLKALINLRWLCLTSCQALVELDANDCKSLVRVYISKCIQLEVLDLTNSIGLELVSLSFNNSLQLVDLGSGKCLQWLTLWFCEKLSNVDMGESVGLSEFKKRGCPLLMNVHGCNRISENVRCLVLTRWHRILEDIIIGLQGSMFLQVLDLWDCPMSRIPDLRKCSRLRELKLTDVDVLLLQTDNRKLGHEYVDILCAADDELALPASLQELIIVACRNTAVKEMCWKLHGLTNLSVLSMQRVRVSWEWELYRSNTKAGFNTQSSLPRDLKSLRSVLHQMLDKCMVHEMTSAGAGMLKRKRSYELVGEPEMTSSSEEGECMDEKTTSRDSDEVTTTDSIEMPGDVPNSGDQIAQINSPTISATRREFNMPSNIMKYLYHVIYWIHKFVGLRNCQMQKKGKVESIIEKQWQELQSLRPFKLEEYEFVGEDWMRLVMSGDMGKVHYNSPEYVFLETFHSFDTLCEPHEEEQRQLTIRQAREFIIGWLRQFTIRQLRQQLFVVRALGPDHMHFFDWQPWEQKVLEEIFVFENMVESVLEGNAKERMRWERYGGDGILFSSWRLVDLENSLLSLMKLRHWKFEGEELVVTTQAEREQWKQEWLVSCKVCMCMQELGIVLERHGAVEEDLSWHRRWLDDMIRDVECYMIRDPPRDWDRLSTLPGDLDVECYMGDLDVLPGEWKAYQWLRKLAFTLSTRFVPKVTVHNAGGSRGLPRNFTFTSGKVAHRLPEWTSVDRTRKAAQIRRREKLLAGAATRTQWELGRPHKLEAGESGNILTKWVEDLCRLLDITTEEWQATHDQPIKNPGVTILHPANDSDEAAFYEVCQIAATLPFRLSFFSKTPLALREVWDFWEFQTSERRVLERLQIAFQLAKVKLTRLQRGSTKPEHELHSFRAKLDAFLAKFEDLPQNLWEKSIRIRSIELLGSQVSEKLEKYVQSHFEECRQSKRKLPPCDLPIWSKEDLRLPLFQNMWDAINQQPFLLPIRSNLELKLSDCKVSREDMKME